MDGSEARLETRRVRGVERGKVEEIFVRLRRTCEWI
jgi:hypothetical protein